VLSTTKVSAGKSGCAHFAAAVLPWGKAVVVPMSHNAPTALASPELLARCFTTVPPIRKGSATSRVHRFPFAGLHGDGRGFRVTGYVARLSIIYIYTLYFQPAAQEEN